MWTIITYIVKWYRLFYDDRENKLVGIGPRYRGAAVNAPSMGTQRGAATCTSGPAEIRRFGAEKFENRLLGSTNFTVMLRPRQPIPLNFADNTDNSCNFAWKFEARI